MKRMILFALAALILFGAFGYAEEAVPEVTTIPAVDGYEIEAVIPEGYSMNTYEMGLGVRIELTPADPTRPDVVMTVIHSEEMEGVTLNGALTEEQEAQLFATLVDDTANVEISYAETAHGTHLILIHEDSDADEYLAVLTIWNGYEIEADIFPGEGQTNLTDEQIETALQFISDFFIFKRADN